MTNSDSIHCGTNTTKSYKNSIKVRKKYLAEICKQHKTWKLRMAIYVSLITIAIAIIVGCGIMLILHPLDLFGVFCFFSAAIGFACVPFFISCSVKNTAKYKCGFPYSSFANGNLILYDDKIELLHWRTGKEEPASYSSKRAVYREEDCFVYTIAVSDIKSLKIDKNHICYIQGAGSVSQPDWAGTKGVREEIPTNKFSFLMDFEDLSAERECRKLVS